MMEKEIHESPKTREQLKKKVKRQAINEGKAKNSHSPYPYLVKNNNCCHSFGC